MKVHRSLTTTLLACSLALLGTCLHAAEASSRLDSHALAELKRMGTSLGAAKTLSYKASNTHEVAAKTGQFVTLFSEMEVALQRPNKLRVQVAGEAPRFDFVYDGATAAASAPGTKTYSSAKAPPSIDGMLAGLERETGIHYASAPLLFSDPYEVLARGLSSAVVIGPVTVHGVPCVHLAFRSPGVNWEIWIESGPRALPQRLAVTYTDRPNFPRTLVEFSDWNLHPWLSEGSFVFHAPAGAREIPFVAAMQAHGR